MTLLPDRTKWMLLTGLGCLLAAGTAAAQSNPASCTNDVDCVATPACGGDVCDWSTAPMMKCKPAGVKPAGMDGWCTTDDSCKCKGLGRDLRGRLLHVHPPLRRPGRGRLHEHGR